MWTEDETQNSLSSHSSWSSSGTNTEESCISHVDSSSKRSSSVMSSENSESIPVGTDFTRDFYRLVKFESSKSLASSSSKSHHGGGIAECKSHNYDLLATHDDCTVDREQALQSVLKFIAEQQCYCISRLVQDEQHTSSAFERMENDGLALASKPNANQDTNTFHEDDDGYFSKISFDNGTGFEDATLENRSCCTNAGTITFCDNESSMAEIMNAPSTAVTEIDTPSLNYKTLFQTCDTCFQSIENISHRGENICEKCAESYIDCLLEETSLESGSKNESWPARYLVSPPAMVVQKSCLDTVLEEQEEVPNMESTEGVRIPVPEPDFVNFPERATSKEVIEELNRMIRKGDELQEHQERTTPISDLDESFGCSTGWVHVEQDIDFNDPKVSSCSHNKR